MTPNFWDFRTSWSETNTVIFLTNIMNHKSQTLCPRTTTLIPWDQAGNPWEALVSNGAGTWQKCFYKGICIFLGWCHCPWSGYDSGMMNLGLCPCVWGDLDENPMWLVCRLSGNVVMLWGIGRRERTLHCPQAQRGGRRNKEEFLGKRIMRFKR